LTCSVPYSSSRMSLYHAVTSSPKGSRITMLSPRRIRSKSQLRNASQAPHGRYENVSTEATSLPLPAITVTVPSFSGIVCPPFTLIMIQYPRLEYMRGLGNDLHYCRGSNSHP